MMCYSDKDDELWNEDPYEYIRMKFGQYTCVNPCVHVHVCAHGYCTLCTPYDSYGINPLSEIACIYICMDLHRYLGFTCTCSVYVLCIRVCAIIVQPNTT